MEHFKYIADDDVIGERIDKCIATMINGISRSYLQKLITDGCLHVNGLPVKVNYKIKTDDEITVDLPIAKQPDIEPQNIPLDILYEDDDVLVVNKGKNVVVHPSAGHYSNTLVNAVLYHCNGSLSGINGILRPGIVHRIDKDTTGSVIICKNDASHICIAEQLKEHSIVRTYRAIVYGHFTESDGLVNLPIGRSPKDRKKMAVVPDGKNAVTHYHVLDTFRNYTYLELQLETGRTHQIRVHMAQIGHPLLGDEVYGRENLNHYHTEGQALHAYLLGFRHPVSGEYIETIAPLPDYFENLLHKLKQE